MPCIPKLQESLQNLKKVVKTRYRQWITIRKYLTDTAGDLHLKKTHSDCNNMHKTCISPTQNKSQNVGGVVVTQSYT